MKWPLARLIPAPAAGISWSSYPFNSIHLRYLSARPTAAVLGTCVSLVLGSRPARLVKVPFYTRIYLVGAWPCLTFTRSRDTAFPQNPHRHRLRRRRAAAIWRSAKVPVATKVATYTRLRLLVFKATRVGNCVILCCRRFFSFCFAARKFLAMSATQKLARQRPLRFPCGISSSTCFSAWWSDFVHIGGVLRVFTYLVVPAGCATYLVNRSSEIRRRLDPRYGGDIVSLSLPFSFPFGAAILLLLGPPSSSSWHQSPKLLRRHASNRISTRCGPQRRPMLAAATMKTGLGSQIRSPSQV